VFVGHLAVALGAKTVEPRAPLAVYVAAAFGLDLLWPVFLLAGIETVRVAPDATAFTPLDFVSYPWSHSLLMSAVWASLAALAAVKTLRVSRAAVAIGLAVGSHWILDWITHAPDLPLWPGGPRAGLGLWNSIPATLAVEGALFAIAVAFYARSTPARDAAGRWLFRLLVAIVTGIWISGPFSPPPPSVRAVIVVTLLLAPILPAWAAWIERHRRQPPARLERAS
jgi:membrane-bound metal-dependent hydrolase YbcI (DUF457 family)